MARLVPPRPSHRRARGRGTPSRRATRVAFVVIVLFVLAQVVWWILFQERYIGGVIEERLAAWQRDAAAATLLLGRSDDPAAAAELLARYPHLRLAPGSGFEVDPAARQAFLDRQRGYLRMFAFEGPFFVLVILALLGFIARSLRAERELKRSRQNFLAAITHEFKTPISTLKLLIQTARKRALPPDKQQEYLRRMEGELDRLERTAEQVLASARLEQARERRGARADAQLDTADLNDLAARLVARARPGLEARGARLAFVPSDTELPVAVEPDAFGVVLNNLLDNAVKYSFEEPKRVRVTLERRGARALLHVDDWGIGVPEAERERIFERFYRSGDEMTRRAPGVGLGLHLARRIATAMEASVESGDNPDADGGGSRFTVALPLRPEPVGPQLGAPEPAPAGGAP